MQVKIGEKIKELRKRDGRKQEDLAGALGVTAQAVSRWESGACYPDVTLIPAIANYFHVPSKMSGGIPRGAQASKAPGKFAASQRLSRTRSKKSLS